MYLLKDIKYEARMYNSYHSLMTTLKSLYLVFCCNNFIINPDFVVRLQVTSWNRDSLPICNVCGIFQRVSSWIIDVKWICFVCGYLSIAVSLSLSSACTPSFVLMINEANILFWQTVVTLNWSTTATTMRCPYGVRQLTHAIVRTIAWRGTLL